VLVTRVSPAQDAPGASPPSAPASPDSAAPPDTPAPPAAEPAPSTPAPSDAPSPPTTEPAPAPANAPPPPSGTPPSTGSAAFEPLPDSAKPKRPARTPAAAPAPVPAATPTTTEAPNAPPLTTGASTPSNTAASSESPAAKDDDDTNGLFGPFRIGLLIGGGLPDLLSLGGAIKLTRYFGAGINVGLIPTVKISYYGDATLSFQEYDAYGRIYPFGGALFLGAGVGYATVRGTLATHFDLTTYRNMFPAQVQASIPPSLDVSSQASVRTLVLTPQLGLLHTFGSGFSIGADVGAQLPIAPSQVDFSTQVPAALPAQVRQQYVDPNDAKVRSSLDKIGRTPIPTFNIKVGFLL